MARKTLLDQDGVPLVVQEGESYNFNCTFKDVESTPATLEESDITAVTITLYDEDSLSIINSRNNQSVKDANQGVLSSAGALSVLLGPLDNIVVSSTLAAEGTETHVLRIKWTWNDLDADGATVERTGKSEYEFKVEKLASPS